MAIKVGTTALPITAAIKNEYCASLTMPCVSPNNAEMLPLQTFLKISDRDQIPRPQPDPAHRRLQLDERVPIQQFPQPQLQQPRSLIEIR